MFTLCNNSNFIHKYFINFQLQNDIPLWQCGEAYFAEKLLDFELASNVGNWQWAAGTGYDAAPYFRVFNPEIQLKKFDEKGIYIRKWIPKFDLGYNEPMVDHALRGIVRLLLIKQGL